MPRDGIRAVIPDPIIGGKAPLPCPPVNQANCTDLRAESFIDSYDVGKSSDVFLQNREVLYRRFQSHDSCTRKRLRKNHRRRSDVAPGIDDKAMGKRL